MTDTNRLRCFRRRCRECEPSPQSVAVPLRTQAGGAAKRGTTSSQYSPLTLGVISRLAILVSRSMASDGCTPPRVLPRHTPLATEARGCSDLRGNKLRVFQLESFLSQATQLEELYAAARSHVPHCRLAIGSLQVARQQLAELRSVRIS